MTYRSFAEAAAAFEADRAFWTARGVSVPHVRAYAFEGLSNDTPVIGDAQPVLGGDPNAGVPWALANIIDPNIFEFLFAPTNAAKILGEERHGSWENLTIMFPTTEETGEVSTYGDHAQSGMSGVNINFPQRQNYLFQTMKSYGDREMAMLGLARVALTAALDKAAANNLNRFQNWTYFYGVAGLQNYGLFNDPNLSASLTPAAKAYGGTTWYSSGVVRATANEIWLDIQDLYAQLVSQGNGTIDKETKMVLSLSNVSEAAFMTTNGFNVNVSDLIKKNLPGLRIQTAVQYGVQSSTNSQGNPAGNFMQLIAEEVEGQRTGFCAFSEKMRSFPIIRKESSYVQKVMGGSWGAVIRAPVNVASMIGI